MKNYIALIILLSGLFLVSCKEEPPGINFVPSKVAFETTYVDLNVPTPQMREVLLEDISGVRCVNCPDAARIVKDLAAAYPGRFNAITIQPKTDALNTLTLPVNKPDEGFVSKYDMRTETGGKLLTSLGTPNSLPSGYINRKFFAGKTYRFLERTEWTDKVVSEKDSVTPVNIDFEDSLGIDGKLYGKLVLHFTADLTGDYYISLALLQDSIIDVQETTDPNVGATYIADYVHMHLLRKMITDALGDKINNAKTTLVRGRVVKKSYEIDLSNEDKKPAYDKKHLKVIAFVQRGSDNVVVQSKEFDLTH